MSQRHNVTVSKIENAYGGKSPNAFVPAVTVEIRVHFPPYKENKQLIIDTLQSAVDDAFKELNEEHLDTLW